MADSVEFSLIGLDSLLGKFESIAYDVKRKGGRAALRKAAQLIANVAKQNAQALDDSETGRSIADNVALRWNGRIFKRSGDLGFRVGVLQGAKTAKKGDPALPTNTGSATPHWRLLEFGTSKMAAKPFLRKALADNIGAATSEFLNQYEKSIDRAIKRAQKKAVT